MARPGRAVSSESLAVDRPSADGDVAVSVNAQQAAPPKVNALKQVTCVEAREGECHETFD